MDSVLGAYIYQPWSVHIEKDYAPYLDHTLYIRLVLFKNKGTGVFYTDWLITFSFFGILIAIYLNVFTH